MLMSRPHRVVRQWGPSCRSAVASVLHSLGTAHTRLGRCCRLGAVDKCIGKPVSTAPPADEFQNADAVLAFYRTALAAGDHLAVDQYLNTVPHVMIQLNQRTSRQLKNVSYRQLRPTQ